MEFWFPNHFVLNDIFCNFVNGSEIDGIGRLLCGVDDVLSNKLGYFTFSGEIRF
jgi:hypothetical protein